MCVCVRVFPCGRVASCIGCAVSIRIGRCKPRLAFQDVSSTTTVETNLLRPWKLSMFTERKPSNVQANPNCLMHMAFERTDLLWLGPVLTHMLQRKGGPPSICKLGLLSPAKVFHLMYFAVARRNLQVFTCVGNPQHPVFISRSPFVVFVVLFWDSDGIGKNHGLPTTTDGRSFF